MNKALFAVFAAWFLFCTETIAANAFSDDTNTSDVENEIESLRLRLDKLEQKANTPQIRPNLFNPGITAFGNFLTCVGQGYPESAHGLCEKPFSFREAELDIRASVDPWADAVFILAFEPAHSHAHDDEHGEASFNVEIEEAYITLKKLPIINDTPWRMQLKAGRFRPSFGRFNQIHLHDLPQMTPPASLQAFLGPHGLMRNGFSAQFMIPTPGENNALNLTLQIMDGGGLPLNTSLESRLPSGLMRLGWYWELAPNHDLEIGASGYIEPKPGDLNQPARPTQFVQLYGADVNYRWRPYVFGDKNSFLLGGEVYWAPIVDDDGRRDALGLFGWAQFQFDQWTYLGVRYDFRDAADRGHAAGVFLTYYTTEFLRLRVGYEAVMDEGFSNLRNNALFEINFVFGSHPVEPYWVNR